MTSIANNEVRIFINTEIKCAQCDKKKTKNGYENLDGDGNWFCSHRCEQMHNLYKNYF